MKCEICNEKSGKLITVSIQVLGAVGIGGRPKSSNVYSIQCHEICSIKAYQYIWKKCRKKWGDQ